MLQPGFGFRALTDRLCRAAGFTPRTAFESTDLATIEGLVGAGLGVAVLPAPTGAGRTVEGDAVFVPLRDAGARRDIGLVWRRAPPSPRPPRGSGTSSWPPAPAAGLRRSASRLGAAVRILQPRRVVGRDGGLQPPGVARAWRPRRSRRG